MHDYGMSAERLLTSDDSAPTGGMIIDRWRLTATLRRWHLLSSSAFASPGQPKPLHEESHHLSRMVGFSLVS